MVLDHIDVRIYVEHLLECRFECLLMLVVGALAH
jgi:hypothetical protein